jgi:N-acylglucosamine-6-phosphate 2-epimerase
MPFPLEILTRLQHGLIVSCHVDDDEPEGGLELLSYFVRAAEQGGAAGLRIEGIEHVRHVRPLTRLPIIGFTQGSHEDGSPLITPGLHDVESLLAAGADIIAVDGILFFEMLRKRVSTPLWADVATFREGVRAAESGADVVATTLAGYTPGTFVKDYRTPDFTLIHELSRALTIPVVAEGRIWDPDTATKAIALGAHAVVVGTAITRPKVVTEVFVNAIKSPHTQ